MFSTNSQDLGHGQSERNVKEDPLLLRRRMKQNDRLALGSWCVYCGNAVPSLCIQGSVPQAGCVLSVRGRVVYSPSPVMPLMTRRDRKSSRG